MTVSEGGAVRIEGVRIDREIGRGATSVVYEGTQTRFQRRVAVKVLELPGQSELISRLFLNECRTVGRLTAHPNIVTLFDCGIDAEGRPYLIMEYLPDGNLASELAEHGPLPVEKVLPIGVQLAGALHTTHLHDIVHGDVKPQNVLRTRTGEVAISDFGVARMVSVGGASTRVPLISPLHAAPELFDGASPTPRTDVYELCSTLFELLDGRPSIGEAVDSPLVIVGRLARGERRRLDRSRVPAELVEVIEAGLSVDPADRPRDAGELGEALRSVQVGRSEVPTPLVVFDQLPAGNADTDDGPLLANPAEVGTLPPPRRRRAWVVAVAVVAVALGAAVTGLLLGRSEEPEPEVAAESVERTDVEAAVAPGVEATSSTEASEPGATEAAPGIQPDVTYDVSGNGRDTSVVLAERLGDPKVLFSPLGRDPNVLAQGLPGIRTLPATLRYQAYNSAYNPACTEFQAGPLTLTGAWFRAAAAPGSQAALLIYQFVDRAQAAQAFHALSLEAGAEVGECSGFDASGRAANPGKVSIDHDEVEMALPPNDGSNNWIGPPPAGVSGYSSVRTAVVLVGDVVVSGYFGDQAGPVAPERLSSLFAGAVERLS